MSRDELGLDRRRAVHAREQAPPPSRCCAGSTAPKRSRAIVPVCAITPGSRDRRRDVRDAAHHALGADDRAPMRSMLSTPFWNGIDDAAAAQRAARPAAAALSVSQSLTANSTTSTRRERRRVVGDRRPSRQCDVAVRALRPRDRARASRRDARRARRTRRRARPARASRRNSRRRRPRPSPRCASLRRSHASLGRREGGAAGAASPSPAAA